MRLTKQAVPDRPNSAEEHARAVTAVARVARALVGAGGLRELGDDALAEISDALDLDVVAMYTPDPQASTVLRLFKVWPLAEPGGRATDVLPLAPEAWRFLTASGGPLVLRERDALILQNPFRPAADWWVAIPLLVQGTIVGAVFGASREPIALGPLARATLGSIADLLSAGVATAGLRMELQRTELQRERMALMADLHDGLAQDLALAVREIAFLESDPSLQAVATSTQRLGEAVRAAHRLVRAGLEDLAANVPEPGLNAAVEAVVERFRRRGLVVQLANPGSGTTVDAAVVAVTIRVLNESLANIERHAGSTTASVALSLEEGTLRLRVSDEGVGLDPDRLPAVGEGHFGVAIMRQRAVSVGGALFVGGEEGVGTHVELRVPLAGSLAA